MNMVNSAD